MNREIKFRAWDKQSRKWCDPEDVALFAVFTLDNKGEYSLYEITQFTGIKDKNGLDIYEGDIVQFEKDGEIRQLPVEYDDLWAGFSPLSWEKGPCRRFEFEVVGNICDKEGKDERS